MLFLARQLALRDSDTLGNPTIIVITDREDLDTQASKLFCASTTYLNEVNVRSIESRQDMKSELGRPEQWWCVYYHHSKVLCRNRLAFRSLQYYMHIRTKHTRTQTNTGGQLTIDPEKGVRTTFGFAKYLRDSFPRATYVGFTGTPIDETIHVFGDVVDMYTMKESCEDGITVPINIRTSFGTCTTE